MIMRKLFALIFCLPLLSLVACNSLSDIERYGADELKGRRGRKLEIIYHEGQCVSEFTYADGGLTITIERAITNYDDERVELVAVVESSYPDELRATVDDLFIDYHGKRYHGYNTRWGWRNGASKKHPSFRPGEKIRYCWVFPLYIRPQTGTYPVTITKVQRVVDGIEKPLGTDISFPLSVPGPPAPTWN